MSGSLLVSSAEKVETKYLVSIDATHGLSRIASPLSLIKVPIESLVFIYFFA